MTTPAVRRALLSLSSCFPRYHPAEVVAPVGRGRQQRRGDQSAAGRDAAIFACCASGCGNTEAATATRRRRAGAWAEGIHLRHASAKPRTAPAPGAAFAPQPARTWWRTPARGKRQGPGRGIAAAGTVRTANQCKPFPHLCKPANGGVRITLVRAPLGEDPPHQARSPTEHRAGGPAASRPPPPLPHPVHRCPLSRVPCPVSLKSTVPAEHGQRARE